MIHVEIHETIEQPIEDVFEQLIDIDGYPDWMPEGGLFVTCSQESEGPVGEGTRYRDVTRLGTVRGDVVAFRAPREVTFHYTARLFGVMAMEGWPGYTLEPAGAGATRVHHVANGRLYGPFRLFRPLVQRIAEGERRRTVDALKASLEGAHGTLPGGD